MYYNYTGKYLSNYYNLSKLLLNDFVKLAFGTRWHKTKGKGTRKNEVRGTDS
jgi:hypothetical protein